MPKRGNKGHRKVTKKGDAAPGPTVPLTEEQQKELEAAARTATGVLASLPLATDIKIEQFSLNLSGIELLVDAKLELNMGRRYGLIGLNGSGKSTFLKCLAAREVPIPKHIDILLVDREQRATDKTALECVIEDLEATRERLEQEAEDLCLSEEGAGSDLLTQIYERLEALDIDVATAEASKLLYGLGFTSEMQKKKAREFSGGWRMRIALAKALFVKPTMLLLDEPTNHLDLEACVWLEEYLMTYPTILVMVSHSQDFLNGVCTNIMLLKDQELTYYGGNYDTYIRSRAEKETNQMKQYDWEQAQIAHIKDYIARFGHGSAKLASQAKSRMKVLAKMEDAGLTERVSSDKVLRLEFTDVGTLPPPVLQFIEVSFGYNLPAGAKKGNFLYRKLDFGIDLDSRVALVGPNGAGKSTLLNLMEGNLNPTDGMVKRQLKLRIGKYKQHLMDQLDGNLTPLEYLMKCFPDCKEFSIKALSLEVTKEAYSFREDRIPKDWNYDIDSGFDRKPGLWPPENKADNPSLHNPLLRQERMGCGWLGAIFEWEGVLIEDNPEIEKQAWLALSQEEGKSPPPAFILRRIEGMKNEQAISEVLCWSRDPSQLRRMAARKEEIYQALQGGIYRLRAGSKEFVNVLMHYKIPMALVSTRPRETLESAMGKIGIDGDFNVIIAAEDVHRGKPDPEMFVYAAQLLNFIPERCIVFGNSNQTVEAAHDARMKCVAVASKHPVYELAAADLVVRRLDELTVVDLKNLADIESSEFGPGEPELEMEVEEDDESPSTITAVDDIFW